MDPLGSEGILDHRPPREISKTPSFLSLVQSMEEMAANCAGSLFSITSNTNPDLDNILGDTDFDFEDVYVVFTFLGPSFAESWIFRF